MGFWDVTKRLVMGQPAFQVPPDDKQWDDSDEPTVDFAEERAAKREEVRGLHDGGGIKRIPEVAVRTVKHHLSGNTVEVWAMIHNVSDRVIELDKVLLLGQKRELDYILKPGAERELSVYKGPVMTHDHYKKAELYYKDEVTGDCFCATHAVHYEYESHNNTYNVNGLTIIRPIRDI